MKKIILASASPAKKAILKQIGLKFKIIPSNFEEVLDQKLNPKILVRKISLGKAKEVAAKCKNSIIIGADLIVVFEGKVLGKPKDRKDAYNILMKLNGKCHSIITGLTLIDSDSGKSISKTTETKVYFRKLTPNEIKAYVKTGEPMGKGGAYAIQGLGAVLVEKINGDYSNVIGLPISTLIESLKELGNIEKVLFLG